MKALILALVTFGISATAFAQNVRMNAVSLDRGSFSDEFVPQEFSREEFVGKLRELESFKRRIKDIDSMQARETLLTNKENTGTMTEAEWVELQDLRTRRDQLIAEKAQLLNLEVQYTQTYLTRYSYAADPWMEGYTSQGVLVRCHLSPNKLILAQTPSSPASRGIWPTAYLSESAGPYITFILADQFSFGVDYYEETSGGSIRSVGQLSMPKAFRLPNSAQQICPIASGSQVYMRQNHVR